MRITYGVSEEVYVIGESRRVAYGIAAYADAETDQTSTIVASVNDISSDREAVEKLVELCNSLELDVVHLNDVVEDFLGYVEG